MLFVEFDHWPCNIIIKSNLRNINSLLTFRFILVFRIRGQGGMYAFSCHNEVLLTALPSATPQIRFQDYISWRFEIRRLYFLCSSPPLEQICSILFMGFLFLFFVLKLTLPVHISLQSRLFNYFQMPFLCPFFCTKYL